MAAVRGEFLFDKRLVRRNVRMGLLQAKSYHEHLKALTDVASNLCLTPNHPVRSWGGEETLRCGCDRPPSRSCPSRAARRSPFLAAGGPPRRVF
jgi:hypothetical protein